jgi:4-amino-4-deoxy-L-arabinose transferase-like glycosyltransferase
MRVLFPRKHTPPCLNDRPSHRGTFKLAPADIMTTAPFTNKPEQKSGVPRLLLLILGAALLIIVMAAELSLSARQQSQTFDEGVHIFAGYRYWKISDFGIDPEVPPLVKYVAAIPLLRMRLRVPSALPDADYKLLEYAAGRSFLYANDATILLWRARMAVAVFTLCLALAIFLVGKSMLGDGPAFLALLVLIFEPNFLAHGALVTTDIGVTLGIFLGVAAFYFYLKNPSALRLAAAGLAAGFCMSVKHSGILLFPMLLVLAIGELLPMREPGTKKIASGLAKKALRQVATLAAITVIAFVVLWTFYGFRYAARPPGMKMNPSLPELAKDMGQGGSEFVLLMARFHLLPESYLCGLADISTTWKAPTVILGKYYSTAQWFYFPSVFVVKTTLSFLALCCLAPLGIALQKKRPRRELIFLMVPPAIYGTVAIFSGINIGVRHILPLFPFLILLVSYAAWSLGSRHRALAAAVVVLLVLHAASSIHAFPNYIPYANELWGGSSKAHELLADSNVDWGQGLVAMKRYIDQRHIQNCWFAYMGAAIVDVSYYGIPCKPLPTAYADLYRYPTPSVPPQVDGPVFISSTEIAGTIWREAWVNPYIPFQRMPPAALIADSILVYDGIVDTSQVAALEHENHAMQLLGENKLDQALTESENAVAIAPNRPIAHVTRGNVLSALGRNEEADEEIKKANLMAQAILAQGSH